MQLSFFLFFRFNTFFFFLICPASTRSQVFVWCINDGDATADSSIASSASSSSSTSSTSFLSSSFPSNKSFVLLFVELIDSFTFAFSPSCCASHSFFERLGRIVLASSRMLSSSLAFVYFVCTQSCDLIVTLLLCPL